MNKLDGIMIRKYATTDLEQLIEIAKTLPEWFTAGGIKQMSIDFRFQHGFVALNGSRIVGFLTFFVNESIAQIGWMGVLSEFHNQGIGKKLIDRLILKLKKVGIQELRVSTLGDSVEYEPYARTRTFYRRIGFKDLQRIKQNNPEWPELLILVKNI
jgi:GNAT superfamily N-acetyltransferase